MRTLIGIVLMVTGVLLLVFGYQKAESLKGQLKRIVTSSTDNNTTWMYVGGASLCVGGVFHL
jgi:uncharacterized membrane protein YidH (DUF202 family)